jgi:hypothetical protein
MGRGTGACVCDPVLHQGIGIVRYKILKRRIAHIDGDTELSGLTRLVPLGTVDPAHISGRITRTVYVTTGTIRAPDVCRTAQIVAAVFRRATHPTAIDETGIRTALTADAQFTPVARVVRITPGNTHKVLVEHCPGWTHRDTPIKVIRKYQPFRTKVKGLGDQEDVSYEDEKDDAQGNKDHDRFSGTKNLQVRDET